MLLFLLACAKPVPPTTTPFLPPFDREEPPARPDLVRTPGDCSRSEPMVPGAVVECHGVLVSNAQLHDLRYDAADGTFWEDAARVCWRYRETDRALCNGTVAAAQATEKELRGELKHATLGNQVGFPLGLATGAAVTIILAFALDRAIGDSPGP